MEHVKAHGMKKNNMPRNLTLLVEVVGCLVFMLLVSWSTVWRPVVMVEMYAGYLMELSLFRFSTHSVFIIGNFIIILVLVQSGKLTPTQKIELLHEHYVEEESRPRVGKVSFKDDDRKSSNEEPGETQLNFHLYRPASPVPEDERTVVNEITPSKNVAAAAGATMLTVIPENSQLYRRTLSASYERGVRPNPELRRSKTVKWGSGAAKVAGTFDDLNHHEFRRKIETFIANQRRSIREE